MSQALPVSCLDLGTKHAGSDLGLLHRAPSLLEGHARFLTLDTDGLSKIGVEAVGFIQALLFHLRPLIGISLRPEFLDLLLQFFASRQILRDVFLLLRHAHLFHRLGKRRPGNLSDLDLALWFGLFRFRRTRVDFCR